MNFQLNCLGTVQLYFKSVDNFYFSRGLGFFFSPSLLPLGEFSHIYFGQCKGFGVFFVVVGQCFGLFFFSLKKDTADAVSDEKKKKKKLYL